MSDERRARQRRLAAAIRSGDVEAVQRALKDGADAAGDAADFEPEADSPDRPAEPVLVLAAQQGDVNIVRLLLDAGAPIDARGWSSSYSHYMEQVVYDDGPTALQSALYNSRRDVMEHLLERGAQPGNIVEQSVGNPELLRFLLDRGLPPTPAALAAALTSISPREGQLEAVALLLKYGADPDARGWGGLRHVVAALRWGRLQGVRLLLQAGAARPTSEEAQRAVDAAVSPYLDTSAAALEAARALGYEVRDPRSK